jgi:hypothetical protein
MNRYGIFLDDERWPEQVSWVQLPSDAKWTTPRMHLDFKWLISESGEPFPDVISFDHDLGENTETGYDCLKWLIEYCMEKRINLPECHFHTMNPVGRQNMKQLYDRAIEIQNKVSK